MAIISGDGPDKLAGQHGAWSVTFSCTRVTLLSLLSRHRDALIHAFERQEQSTAPWKLRLGDHWDLHLLRDVPMSTGGIQDFDVATAEPRAALWPTLM